MTNALIQRRAVLGILISGATVGAFSFGFAEGTPADRNTLSPPEVLTAVRAGQLTLVDIRRPEEWASTGVAEGAILIDMRRPDFVRAVQDVMQANPENPVAFICARGARSYRVTLQLGAAGITNIVDVPEGMLGSAVGPGWLQRGLPVTEFAG